MSINLEIDYNKLNIDDCFKNHYVVPDYQREYVWEETQVEQLISDIEGAYETNSEKPYFLGMTVVYNGGATLELIDGQQRITTFFIVLCALINIYKDNKSAASIFSSRIYSPVMLDDGEEKEGFSLELQYPSSSECLGNIFHGIVPSDVEFEKLSISDRRLYRAYIDIRKQLLDHYPDFLDLKKFASYFFKKVQFVQIEAKDISDALKIFETINQRGVGLNSMDLLKNMIFMQVSRDDFPSLNIQWKEIIDKIAEVNEKPLRFLRYYITATYDISDDAGNIKGILPEDKIYKWLMDNDKQCSYRKNPFGFVGALKDGLNRYISFLQPSPVEAGNEYLRNITRIAGSSYKSHLVLLLAASRMEEDTFAYFKRILESVIYYSTINHIKGNETEKIFAAWCPLIRQVVNNDDLNVLLSETIIPQVEKWKIEKNHKNNFMSLNLNNIQLYRIRFVLSRITKYVDDVRGGGKNFADVDKCYDSIYQIEHIMPQSCDDYSAYSITEEDFPTYVNKLGNLSLLEKVFNAACQNNSYENKCKIYPQSCFYLTSSLPSLEDVGKNTSANALNKKLLSWSHWNATSIEERQEMLYRLSEEIWDLNSISFM